MHIPPNHGGSRTVPADMVRDTTASSGRQRIGIPGQIYDAL